MKTEAVIKGTQVTEMETTAVSRKRATAKVTAGMTAEAEVAALAMRASMIAAEAVVLETVTAGT